MNVEMKTEFEIDDEVFNRAVEKSLKNLPDFVCVIRCKDCKWFNKDGCAIGIVDDSDKPTENDYCSFAERLVI